MASVRAIHSPRRTASERDGLRTRIEDLIHDLYNLSSVEHSAQVADTDGGWEALCRALQDAAIDARHEAAKALTRLGY